MAPLRKKKRASDILKGGHSSNFGDDAAAEHSHSTEQQNKAAALKLDDRKVFNVAASRTIYEKAKSRRVRTKTALAQCGNADEAVALKGSSRPTKSSSSTGSNHVATMSFARHQHADDGGDFALENQMERAALMRTMKVRHSLKMQPQHHRQLQSTAHPLKPAKRKRSASTASDKVSRPTKVQRASSTTSSSGPRQRKQTASDDVNVRVRDISPRRHARSKSQSRVSQEERRSKKKPPLTAKKRAASSATHTSCRARAASAAQAVIDLCTSEDESCVSEADSW